MVSSRALCSLRGPRAPAQAACRLQAQPGCGRTMQRQEAAACNALAWQAMCPVQPRADLQSGLEPRGGVGTGEQRGQLRRRHPAGPPVQHPLNRILHSMTRDGVVLCYIFATMGRFRNNRVCCRTDINSQPPCCSVITDVSQQDALSQRGQQLIPAPAGALSGRRLAPSPPSRQRHRRHGPTRLPPPAAAVSRPVPQLPVPTAAAALPAAPLVLEPPTVMRPGSGAPRPAPGAWRAAPAAAALMLAWPAHEAADLSARASSWHPKACAAG